MGEKIYELTNPQKSIWFTEQFYKGTPIENIAGSVIINEPVNFKLLDTAINFFVKSNDSFRLKFINIENNIKQTLENFKYTSIEIINVDTKKEVEALEKKLSSTPFEIFDSKLYTIKIFKFSDKHGGFTVNIHHLIADAWTSGLIIDGIMNIYAELLRNPKKIDFGSPSYLDYIDAEQKYLNSDKFIKDKTFWNELYKEVPEVASIPSVATSSKNPTNSSASKRKVFSLPKETFNLIDNFSKQHKASPFNFFMGVFALYLSRVSNLDEFVIGTPILNRSNFKEKHTTGMFISTVPFKVSINHEATFAEFISKISSDFFDVFRHQKYPYQYLLEDLRKDNSSLPNLYDVMISYQNMRTNSSNSDINFSSSWVNANYISDSLDIHFFDINDTGNINIAYDYQTEKYSVDDIYSIHARILNIINQILENKNIGLKDIEIVTPDEKKKILYDFNNTKMDYPKDKTISQLFEEQVEKTPDNIAVVFEDQKLTYKELNEKANSLAYYLRNTGVNEQDIVCILLDKNLEVAISLIAILKCGAIYLPLDINYPSERLTYVIQDCKSKLILTNDVLKDKISTNSLCVDVSLSNTIIYNYSRENLKSCISSDLAYIMYTSGSTGNPKGSMITQQNVIRLVKNTNYLNLNEEHRILQTGSLAFDACTFEFWGALLNGLTVYLITKNDLLDLNKFEYYILKYKITTLFLTTQLFNQFAEEKPDIFNNIKFLLTGGDAVSVRHINRVISSNPSLTLIHCYGPTENTTFSTYYVVDKKTYKSSTIAIGKPIANSTCYIVSKNNMLQPIGVPGELLVGGDGVGKGYLNNPSLTNEKFINCSFEKGKTYKTGDLVKWLPDGNIEFIGRIDNQVKIRGFRIELSEINIKISNFANIDDCVTIIRKINENKVICSYIVSKQKINFNELKSYLKDLLPNYMIPTYFIQLEKLPINTNGKIDRKALPFPEINVNKEIIPSRNSTDTDLLIILKELLNINVISMDDSFFDLGGDSLSAINLCTRIYNKFNIQIFVKDILENPVISDLSDLISSKTEIENVCVIPKAKKAEYYPVSSAQKRMFFASSIAGDDSILYNIPGGVILDKLPDIKKLEECLNNLIARHEALRTYFEIEEDNVVQKIKDEVKFKLDVCKDIIKFDDLKQEFDSFVKPFNLAEAPLLRVKLIKLEDKKVALFVDMHHIIADGTSLGIFINELCNLYNGKTLNKLHISYKDFAVWENNKLSSDEFKEAEDFWVNQFKDDIPVLNMPTNYNRPAVKAYEGSKIYSSFNEETTNKINNICKELGITPYMFLLSVYFILLSKYSSQEDIIVGSPIVGRDMAELYNIIGMFVNSLPIRANIDSNLSFKDFLNNIKNICLENYKYQDYPFDELVDKLNIQRDTSRNPLFDTMFIYQNNGHTDISFDGINSEYYIPDTKISKFDLSLEIVPENNILNLSFEYCTKLFNKSFIENLSNHYSNILNTVLDNIDIQISKICMLSEQEKNKILYDFNNTKMDYPKDKTISQLFEEQVEKTPNNIAVVFEDQKLTYKELNEKANSLAYYLRNTGVNRNDTIGIMVNRSLEMIIGILAVLKSGGAYIPIDPEYPQDRIEYMLENSETNLLLTQKHLEDSINFKNKVFIDLNNKDLYKLNKSNLENINEPEDLSYVIYTSGSTGLPKGTLLTHKALSNLTNYCNNYVEYLKDNIYRNIVSVTTISFDIFIFETLISLQRGLKLIIANEEEQHIPSKLSSLIKRHNIEIIQMTPSRMQIFLDNKEENSLDNIRYVILAGEVLPDILLSNLLSLGVSKIYNGYGPSETTVFSSLTDVTNYSKVNIGKPLSNTQMYILDKNMNPCPINIPGELYIAGDGVGKGYINSKVLTEKNYLKNPFVENCIMYKTGDLCTFLSNGEINCLGRVDNQIKIRGLRIELGEIESKISSYPNIQKSCVVKQTINNRDFLSAYFTATKRINISELRKYLSNFLPKYMVPSYFTVLDDFPYTPNGKINRRELPVPKEILNGGNNKKFVAPKTELEKKFVSVWEKVLSINPIGVDDNFFELGGDSILAMNLNIELKKITDNINYADIFKFPTISELIKKTKSKDENYEFKYMEKNYDKYSEILEKNKKVPNVFNLRYENAGNILLTGATGFLGIHILDSFIKKEKGNVYCIIREEPGLTSQAKLHQKLNYYFGNKYDKLIGKRIFAITGDICKTGFGLNQENLLDLSNNVNTVINTAARVTHYGNYSEFYNTNVQSVKNIIEFCKSFNKKLYHISTLSVSGNAIESNGIKQNMNKTTYFRENNLYINQSLENVYVRSKFEAECLILDSIVDGVNSYILRVGNLMPRFKDGVFQENILENAYINRLVSFVKLGAIPDYIEDGYLEFTPIDATANSIVKLITHPNENSRIFHLFDHNHIYLNKCLKYFETVNSNFEILPDLEFKKKVNKLLNSKKNKEILNSLINDFDKDLHLIYKTDIIIKSDFTIKYLSKIGFKWPKISDKYMIRFLELLRRVL